MDCYCFHDSLHLDYYHIDYCDLETLHSELFNNVHKTSTIALVTHHHDYYRILRHAFHYFHDFAHQNHYDLFRKASFIPSSQSTSTYFLDQQNHHDHDLKNVKFQLFIRITSLLLNPPVRLSVQSIHFLFRLHLDSTTDETCGVRRFSSTSFSTLYCIQNTNSQTSTNE